MATDSGQQQQLNKTVRDRNLKFSVEFREGEDEDDGDRDFEDLVPGPAIDNDVDTAVKHLEAGGTNTNAQTEERETQRENKTKTETATKTVTKTDSDSKKDVVKSSEVSEDIEKNESRASRSPTRKPGARTFERKTSQGQSIDARESPMFKTQPSESGSPLPVNRPAQQAGHSPRRRQTQKAIAEEEAKDSAHIKKADKTKVTRGDEQKAAKKDEARAKTKSKDEAKVRAKEDAKMSQPHRNETRTQSPGNDNKASLPKIPKKNLDAHLTSRPAAVRSTYGDDVKLPPLAADHSGTSPMVLPRHAGMCYHSIAVHVTCLM